MTNTMFIALKRNLNYRFKQNQINLPYHLNT